MVLFISIFTGFIPTKTAFPKSDLDSRILVSKFAKEIDISPGEEFILKFCSENLTFLEKNSGIATSGLKNNSIYAIAKSPQRIQRSLARQFNWLKNQDEYANLILESSKTKTDEIAFSIACSPLGKVPSAELLETNVNSIYNFDADIKYADIVDYDYGDGNFYSTLRYQILENNKTGYYEYPEEIYYWYLVHPELLGGNAKLVYDEFWRDYLFEHNDIGYPLLKEKISNIDYLWDNQSYFQGANRLWKQSIGEHPTAIEAISYWIGKTVPNGATGDRPSQPNIIAHEHNGWCGELQRIAVAALRACLIPSVGASNVAEDHVWREFYERGWHENDNWWTDSGGAVDKADVYGYDWGKSMSAIYSWRGDGSIYDVTDHYIHSEDRININFTVKNINLEPVDGAVITVLVKGLTDVTWYKNKILEKLESIYEKIPNLLKGKILQNIYKFIEDKIDEYPDVVDAFTISTWNYTDAYGKAKFSLGKNHEYFFIIQSTDLNLDWPLSKHTSFRYLSNQKDKDFNVVFLDFSNKKINYNSKEITGDDLLFDISFESKSYQLQKNILNKDIGIYEGIGSVDFFILDESNFNKYNSGQRYTRYNYLNSDKGQIELDAYESDWYIVFHNPTKRSNQIVRFFVEVSSKFQKDFVQIVEPNTSIFSHPIVVIGDKINLSGVASKDLTLFLPDKKLTLSITNNKWMYLWDTNELTPGLYQIYATFDDCTDTKYIELIDPVSPEIYIKNPTNGEIFEKEIIEVSGTSWDNQNVSTVEISIDKGPYLLTQGKNDWSIDIDLSGYNMGLHQINVKATDVNGNNAYKSLYIVINESGKNDSIKINEVFHRPLNPSNTSNIFIYANISSSGPFDTKKVIVYLNDSYSFTSHLMYEYGTNPIQTRHEEDTLYNQPNSPLFGFEIGEFSSGETLRYFVVATDSANNTVKSEELSLSII